MSKDTVEIILAKLQRLDEYLRYLKDLSKIRRALFIQDYHIYGLAERYLQLSIEIVLDIAKLLIIELNLPRPENNHESLALLHKHRILTLRLYKRMLGMPGFRNILVHDYMKIDREIVHLNMCSGLKDFADFRKAVIKKLKRPSRRN